MTAIPRNRRAALVSALCALVVTGTGLTGCGGGEDPDAGTNGVGKLSPAKIHAKTKAAAEGASTVRLSGAVISDKRTYKLDMRLREDGGSGSVTSKGSTFRLLRVGEQLYIKADAGFWSHADDADGGGSASDAGAAEKLQGKYVKVPQGDPAYQQLSVFTDKDTLLDGLLSLHGEVTTDGRHEQNGVRTVRLTGDKGSGGTLDVSLEGRPYPLTLTRAGGAGTLRMTDWNKDFALEEPSEDETVDYGRELPTS
ncbi:hypothetical protein [Streptomyces minutiscleroticus]|uniref:hypothetical protein n=1 Tax=Streptomyces minutiscleroticus TaxID=68238 RepID=UPI00167CE472|nr:hypothetical protein [Streptomyces minutiscleroticus]